MAAGVDAVTGKVITGSERLFQSIQKCLTTPKVTRVHRREFGSDLHLQVDKPMDGGWFVDTYYEAAVAIDRWEPEFTVKQFYVRELINELGKVTFAVSGIDHSTDELVLIEGLTIG